MPPELLGRTNRPFPRVWFSLRAPASGVTTEALVESAVAAETVLDITAGPGSYGSALRGTDATLMAIGNADIERALDAKHASDLLQAHFIETLCGIGRETLDFYFLRIRSAWEEFQITGALEALEAARQEGHVRYLGLYADGPPLAVLGTWQFHDAFEVVMIPRSREGDEPFSVLSPLAADRRVGIVHKLDTAVLGEFAGQAPVLVPVRSPQEIASIPRQNQVSA